ncbi:hypothetical protein [Flagellimonas meridianipacifica]|uniref:Uncharacterized protein n=1 Tax=Flagellimonas meridianipacifica TaxID=1080225 RepID=A0A2T0MBZ6_9FLAO|nr:hypothetical protein [Allomuricauda pacifica]PRX55023.1 hypothetical protein CLV81_3429 [Allomuricauda pacifica]
MGSAELLRYLEKLEIGLSSFSYEELNTSEAGELKRTFNEFKNGLENKVFGVPSTNELEVIYEEIGILKPKAENKTDYKRALEKVNLLLDEFDASGLNKKQNELLQELRQVCMTSGSSEQEDNSVEKSLGTKDNDRINLVPLWEECMHRMDLMEELARLYKQNIFEFVGKTKVHLQSKNVRGLDFSCQKVRPSLRMLHCYTLLEITEQMSKVCKSDNDLKHLNFLYNQFLEEYPKVEKLLDKNMLLFKK